MIGKLILILLIAFLSSSKGDLLPTTLTDPLVGTVQYLADGVTVSGLTIGLITIPIDSGCNQTERYSATSVCRFCTQDCIYAHNAYGGSCKLNPNDGVKYCHCNDERPANGVINTDEVCGTLDGADGVNDAILAAALRTRFYIGICNNLPIFNNLGCATDCRKNHGYSGGSCVQQNGIPLSPDQNATSRPVLSYCACTGNY